MTVSAVYTPPRYTGNGTTTAFPFPYSFFAPGDLVLTLFNTSTNAIVSPAPVLNGAGTYDFTVTGTQDTSTGEYLSGGTVTLNTALPGNYILVIARAPAATQLTSLAQNAPFPSKSVEAALDRVTMLVQEALACSNQALTIPITDTGITTQLPAALARAGLYLGFDNAGNVAALTAVSGSVSVSSVMAPLLLSASTQAALATLGGQTVLASVSALRGNSGAMPPAVTIEGYGAAGDGGGGQFVYVATDTTSSDNGGTIVVDAASRRWYRVAVSSIWSPLWFGVTMNGTTDDTSAWQSAINAAQTANAILAIPPGTTKISAALVITGSLSLIGAGKTSSTFSLATANQTGLSITGSAPVTFASFAIQPAAAITGCTGIAFTPSTLANTESTIRDLQLLNLATGINTQAAANWTIDSVDILNFTNVGIIVRNTINPDQGDSALINCYIQGATTSAPACVEQLSSGGLKIANNKFITAQYGYFLYLDTGVNSSDLLLANNSMENFSVCAIGLSQATSTGSFGMVTIAGNQFNLTAEAISVTKITNGWLDNLAITGNSFSINTNGTAIILDGVTGFTVTGNHIHNLGTGVAFASITANSSNGEIGINGFNGISSYVANSSPTTVVEPRIERGTAAATTAGAYGSAMYASAGTTVTFATPFLTAPNVVVTPTSGTGAVSALAQNITATGFTLVTIGITNSSVLTVEWLAAGN